jgi:hypothetical protein
MTQNPDGTLTVSPGEQVTIKVTKTLSPFAATFAPLVGSSLDSATLSPAGLTETNVFTAPSTVGLTVTATILYDFIPDDTGAFTPGDQYDQTVTGSAGGNAPSITVVPPPIFAQTLDFTVG